MADQGRRLSPDAIRRLRWLCSARRLSVRKAAREAGTSTSTAWKYWPKNSANKS
jgi:hypothetical protein